MIRWKHVAVALLALAAMNGCGNKGDRADPPVGGLQVTPGDGAFNVAWSDDTAVTYWLFISTDPTMTVDNFSTRTDIRIIRSVRAPYDNTVLVMPSLAHVKPGTTMVRLGRYD